MSGTGAVTQLIYKPKGCSGMGILDALVAVAIFGIGIAIVANSFHNAFQSLATSELRDRALTARAFVRGWLDCKKTMASDPVGCKAGGYIDVKQSDGKILVKGDQTTEIGRLNVKAACSGGDLDFQYKPVVAQAGWRSLTDGIPIHCNLPLTITYTMLNSNGAAPRCLFISDANEANGNWTLLGCNPSGAASYGVGATKTIKMSFSGAIPAVRLRYNPSLSSSFFDSAPWLFWRNTNSSAEMSRHMYFNRIDNGDGTSDLEGRIDDSNERGCDYGNFSDFVDIWFSLHISTQNYVLENYADRCH